MNGPLGATGEELAAPLSGDEFVPHPDLTTTRAVTINARAADVWPWIAARAGRGGFHSYDALENLVGCDIHSAAQIVPAWQNIAVGAQVRLAPVVAMTVAIAEPGHALVLRGIAERAALHSRPVAERVGHGLPDRMASP